MKIKQILKEYNGINLTVLTLCSGTFVALLDDIADGSNSISSYIYQRWWEVQDGVDNVMDFAHKADIPIAYGKSMPTAINRLNEYFKNLTDDEALACINRVCKLSNRLSEGNAPFD